MPILSNQIKLFLSGGAANSDPNQSLGGAISATEVPAGLHNLFDFVSSGEADTGDNEYRCVYVKNTHGSLTLLSAVVWLQTQSTIPLSIALAPEGLDGTAQLLLDEGTQPTGLSLSSPTTEETALSVGDIPASSYHGIWIQRAVPIAQAALANDTATLRVKGDTAG